MTVQKLEKDVVVEILSSPQSYLSDIVLLAGRQSADIIKALEAENARLRAEVERLEDRLNDEVSSDDDDIYDGVKTNTTGVSRYEILLLTTIFIGVLMSIYGVAQIG